jgi:arylsulfatase A-like enzyme
MSSPHRDKRNRRLGVGLAAVVLLATLAVACRRFFFPAVELPAGNVVLVLVDTLRADHLGVYGYDRPTSPKLDRFAAGGVVFTQARTVAPWTNPTIASIFTGHHPNALFEPRPHPEAIHLPLAEGLPTLASRLRDSGVRTLAFVDHPGLTPSLGYARGFDSYALLYKELETPAFGTTDGRRIVAAIGERLEALPADRFFLYLHLVYPHRPYAAPPPYDQLFGPTSDSKDAKHRAELLNAYDAEIRYTDDVFDELLNRLASLGLRENTWVLFTSDHGEGFWEHGRREHGNSFYDELLRVPLVLAAPRAAELAARRVDTPVSLIDLHATVLEMAGVRSAGSESESAGEGRSLLRFLRGGRSIGADPHLAQQPNQGDVNGAALFAPPWKLIQRREPGKPRFQLYDLASDPLERVNRARREPEVTKRLAEALARHLAADHDRRLASRSSAEVPELDEETVKRLRALGYLQ